MLAACSDSPFKRPVSKPGCEHTTPCVKRRLNGTARAIHMCLRAPNRLSPGIFCFCHRPIPCLATPLKPARCACGTRLSSQQLSGQCLLALFQVKNTIALILEGRTISTRCIRPAAIPAVIHPAAKPAQIPVCEVLRHSSLCHHLCLSEY